MFDTYSSSSIYQKAILSITGLKPGKHTVRIEVTNNKNSKSSNIVQAIDFIEITNILTVGKYEENHPALSYVGKWNDDCFSAYEFW